MHVMFGVRRSLIACLALLLTLPCACEERRNEQTAARVPAHLPRICAVSPALSQMLVDLELGACIVGRHRFDTSLPPDIPIVGDQAALEYEVLLQVDPTDVLLQFGERAVPPRLEQLAEEREWSVVSFDIDTTADVERVLRDLPEKLTFSRTAGGREARASARRRAADLAAELEKALRKRDAVRAAGPLLLLWSVDPLAAFGPASFLGDVVERLGGDNVLAEGAYPELTLEDVLALDPTTIVLFADDESTASARARLGRLAEFDVRAVREGRLALVQDPQVLIPTTTLPRIADKINAALAALPQRPSDEGAGP